MKSGIYLIRNLKTMHVYIGQSINIKSRIRRHFQCLRDNKHANDYMQKHYNKYGVESFKFEIIELCDIDKLDEKEIYWINNYDSMNRSKGYNLESGGNSHKILSDAAREKKKGSNNPMYGKTWNEKQRENIPIANRGNSDKLTEYDVKDIKHKVCEGMAQKEIAKIYNLHISTVSKIITLRNWNWVSPELNEMLRNYKNRNYALVIELFKSGVKRKQISKKLHMDYRTINKILIENNLI